MSYEKNGENIQNKIQQQRLDQRNEFLYSFYWEIFWALFQLDKRRTEESISQNKGIYNNA